MLGVPHTRLCPLRIRFWTSWHQLRRAPISRAARASAIADSLSARRASHHRYVTTTRCRWGTRSSSDHYHHVSRRRRVANGHAGCGAKRRRRGGGEKPPRRLHGIPVGVKGGGMRSGRTAVGRRWAAQRRRWQDNTLAALAPFRVHPAPGRRRPGCLWLHPGMEVVLPPAQCHRFDSSRRKKAPPDQEARG
jgi:hypothetical protein